MKCAVYIRVSAEEQTADNQLPAIKALCQTRGWDLASGGKSYFLYLTPPFTPPFGNGGIKSFNQLIDNKKQGLKTT